ncbi:MAG: YcxB family protein [Clostridia bacterium]|jgi:hypothetical protein|nr:YcxB family protein [Clostridia bacterium]
MEEKNAIFKNTSKMDDEEISLFQNFVLKKNTIISSLVFSIIFIGGGVGMCFVDLTIGLALAICGVIGGIILLPYLMKESLKKQNKITLGDRKYLNTFEFYEDHIFITSQATSSPTANDYQEIASQKVFYKDLYKFVAYKEHLFIFINQKQSFIFDYRGMTKGTAGEVVEFLKAKGVKFVDKSSVQTPNLQNKKKNKKN